MFSNLTNLIFNGVDEKMSKAGNPYKLAKFIDTVGFQHFELFVSDGAEITALEGKPCKLTLAVNKIGYNTSFSVNKVQPIQG